MNYIKKLAGQTIVYGFSVILTRLINVAVTPIITWSDYIETTQLFGVFTNLYSLVAISQVILAFGLETGYFRFANDKNYDEKSVFSNVFLFVSLIGVIFLISIVFLSSSISILLRIPEYQNLIIILGFVLFIDLLSNVALAKLRYENKARRFARINVISVIIYVSLIVLCVIILPSFFEDRLVYNKYFSEKKLLLYIIIANLAQAFFRFISVTDILSKLRFRINKKLLTTILIYSAPLMIIQFFGIMNQQFEKTIMPGLIGNNGHEILGIYGACAKMILFVTMFNQMFRYAADPFFFSHKNEANAKQIYADVLKYFVVLGLFIVLIVNAYIPVFKYFIGSEFWQGLHIVPYILFAGLLNGIFYNLSFWFKLTDRNKIGIIITGTGSIVFIVLNIILVPLISYKGAAYSMLAANAVIVIFCYLLGRKYYKIPYELIKILFYLMLGCGIVVVIYKLNIKTISIKYMVNTLLIVLFCTIVFITDKKEILNLFKKEKYVS